MRPMRGCAFFYLSHKLVWVCEIELLHMGKNNGNPNQVCDNVNNFLFCSILFKIWLHAFICRFFLIYGHMFLHLFSQI